MKISSILDLDKVSLSLEVFPPKTSDKYESIAETAKKSRMNTASRCLPT